MPARSVRPVASGGTLLALFVVLAVFLAACAGSATSSPSPSAAAVVPSAAPTATVAPTPTASPSPAPAFPVTVTDDDGTAITLASAPQKIVSLTPPSPRRCSPSGPGTGSSPRMTPATTRPRPSPCRMS